MEQPFSLASMFAELGAPDWMVIACMVIGSIIAVVIATLYVVKYLNGFRKISDCHDIHSGLEDRIKTSVKASITDVVLRSLPNDSPINLRTEDRELIKNSGFNQLAEDERNKIINKFREDQPSNKAEGINRAATVIMELDNDDELDLDPLKNAGYQDGKTEIEILVIAGVYVWHKIIEPELYN